IDALAFSRDGKLLAAGGKDRTIRVWETAAWTAFELTGHEYEVLALGFSDDGLVSVDGHGGIKLWRLAARAARDVRRPARALRTAEVSPDGARVALVEEDVTIVERDGRERNLGYLRRAAFTADGNALHALDSRAGAIIRVDLATGARTVVEKKTIPAIALASCGDLVASSGLVQMGALHVVEGEEGRNVPTGRTGPITELACTTDGTVATASSSAMFADLAAAVDPHVIVVRGADLETLRGHEGDVHALAITRDGRRVASAAADGIRVWDRRGTRRAGRFGKPIAAALVSGGRIYLAERGPRFVAEDRAVEIVAWPADATPEGEGWNGMTRSPIDDTAVFEHTSGPSARLVAVAASADRRRFATIDDAQQLIAWEVAGGGRVLGRGATTVAMSHDGTRIAYLDKEGALRTWTLTGASWAGAPGASPAASVATEALLDGDAREADALAYAPDGTLAVAYVGGAILYGREPTRDPPLQLPTDGKDKVNVLAFTPDGATLVGAGNRRTVYAWRVADAVPFGKRGAGPARVHRWTGHDDPIVAIAVSPRGVARATGGANGAVRRWKLADGASEALRGHTAAIAMLAYGPDGTLLSASQDRTVRIWAGPRSRTVRLSHRAVFAEVVDSRIVAIDQGGTVFEVRDDAVPADEVGMRAWIAAALR
ncbi:MAG: hypothetical protein KIT31_36040, partial [Deltaproteobacteria bacterium]|nr:hypothetical protein [Deltaproteobacteria bacterium]